MIPPKGSLTWIDKPEGSYLVQDKQKSSSLGRSYYPAEIPVLFHRLATTEISKEGILAFAETYGVLGVELESWEERWEEFQESERFRYWEKYSNWRGEIKEMQAAYGFWSSLKKNDEATIRSIFALRRWWGGRLRSLNIWQNAWTQIGNITTDALERYPYTIRPDVDYPAQSKHMGLTIKFTPRSLISLIWLQFAQAASSTDRWQICEYCSEPFKPESMKARYCSDSHRQMAYLKRKEAQK